MIVTLSRLDNRLLHGIVISQYLPTTDCNRIMVVDDEVATNPMRKEMMMMAKPNGYAASIITLETALNNFAVGKYEGQRLFILARTPKVFLKLIEAGVPIKEVMLGATDRIGDGIKLSNRCYFTEEEVEDTKAIVNKGIRVIVQHNPGVKAVEFSKIIK